MSSSSRSPAGNQAEPSAAGHNHVLNRFAGRVQSILSEAQRTGNSVAVMIVHAGAIDRVDAHSGFQVGNVLSDKIIGILRTNVLRRHDEIEILSRDEYACILPGVSSPGIAMLAAQRTMTLLGTSPLDLGSTSELADVAVGIAMFPEHGRDAAALLQHAKHALLTARERSDKMWIYEREDAASAIDQSQYVSRMLRALDQNSLGLHFMPQASLRTGRLIGAEALLRWNDEILGSVSPYAAVQIAEANGLIDRLTQWVVTSAVQQFAQFQSIDPHFRIAVNVSPSNLHEPDLALYIDRALRTWGVNSNNLVIEITESAMIANQAAANEVLRELKSYGMRLAIDDFGTGYSSMYYLAQMPLDELKIDQSFVLSMLDAPNSAKIVRSLIDLAHNLELSVVAEGVESEAIMTALARLGCDQAQGYYIGEAMPAADLAARLQEQARRPPPAS